MAFVERGRTSYEKTNKYYMFQIMLIFNFYMRARVSTN